MNGIIVLPIPQNDKPFPFLMHAFDVATVCPDTKGKRPQNRRGHYFLLLQDFYSLIDSRGSCSYRAIAQWCSQATMGCLDNLSPDLKKVLVQQGLLDPKATTNTQILDLERAVAVILSHNKSMHISDLSFLDMLEEDVAASLAGLEGGCPLQAAKGWQVPATPPPCKVSLLTHKYGLNKDGPLFPAEEVTKFKGWRTAVIHTHRPVGVNPVQELTFEENDRSRIAEFLGYCHRYELSDSWQDKWPIKLNLYLQPKLVMSFQSFLLARKVGGLQIKKAVVCASNVVAFLQSSFYPQAPPEEQLIMTTWRDTLQAIADQAKYLDRHTLKRSKADLERDNRWLEYTDLYKVTKLLVSRGQEVAQCGSGSTYGSLLNQECGAQEARQMHDGALAAMQAGYLPPLRPSVVMSLKHPDFAQEACTREGCKYQSCYGNRLVWQAGHTKLELVVMHHKNMWKSKQPIRVMLPDDLLNALLPWVAAGHHKLLGPSSATKTLFCSNGGLPFDTASYCMYYGSLIKAAYTEQTGKAVSICPQRARHIFVDWVRSQETATNLDEDAAAMIMGNSVKTWNAVYHLAFVEQQAQRAVDGMAQVRAELDGIIDSQAVEDEQAAPEESDSDGYTTC